MIVNPAAGVWTAVVQGFTVQTLGNRKPARDRFTLRVTADGTRVKAIK